MSVKTQYIVLGSVVAFFLFLKFLELLHITIGLFFLFLLLFGVYLILFLPKPFARYIYKLVHVPRNVEIRRSDFNKGIRVIIVLVIMTIHDRFWSFITRYYPFSLMYRDRLFHAKNQSVQAFIHEIEAYAQKIHLPFTIQAGDGSDAMALFWAHQTGGRKLKKDVYLEKLREKLQEKYETIYISPEESGFTIRVPTIMVKRTQV